ncbi:hypothetical protein N7G274_004813 [Stereocaulon virgatum]|uniref:Tetraspanin Tsp3 n=1 Tax=Stereocaulon virgatum TaxID=373712 RepID=A0ABR4AA31_9LECA
MSLLVPLLLLGLIIPAGIALYRIRAFAIPISRVTATATIILPVLTGISLRGAQRLASRSNGSLTNAKPSLSWATIIIFMLLTIYETAIATLALTHMAPPSNLNCQLHQQWSRLFSNKDAEVIRRIQDRYQCCGLRSTVDMAWPFPDRSHPVTACRDAFNRQNSCLGGWRRDEQMTAGLMLLVAGVVFLIKPMIMVVHRTRHSFPSYWWPARGSSNAGGGADDEDGLEANEEEVRAAHNRRRIEGSAYRDDPLVEDARPAGDSEPNSDANHRLLQPSRLHSEGNNEWR